MNFEKDTFFEKDGKTWVRDLSGRGNDGVCEGVAFTPDGKAGGGLACQGGALRIPHSLIHGQANYTITGWCRWDEIVGGEDVPVLYRSSDADGRSPLFLLGVGTGCDFHVHAWNKDYPPTNWLNVWTPAGTVPKGWYFFAVTMKEGGVGKGALRVTLNDATYDLATQKVERDVPSECDFVGYKMPGAVIDELTVFQRALSDDEIRALRELGRNNVPLARAEAASAPPATPFTDADVQRIAALPAEQQVEEVRKELMRRNPGFDGKMDSKIEDGVVTGFKIVTDQVTDIAPIRVFDALRVLECRGTWTNDGPNGLLADLTPLKGMNLAGLRYLSLSNTKVSDAGWSTSRTARNFLSSTSAARG